MKPQPNPIRHPEALRGLDRLVDAVCRVMDRQPSRTATKRAKISREPVGKSA